MYCLVDLVTGFRDQAEALRSYAKQANNRDAEVQFADRKWSIYAPQARTRMD